MVWYLMPRQVYELATGFQLFNPYFQHKETGLQPAQIHVIQMVGLCGDFPEDFLSRARRSARHFDERGKQSLSQTLVLCLQKSLGALRETSVLKRITMEQLLVKRMPLGTDANTILPFAAFLRKMVQIRPEDRLDAEQLLADSWLSA